MKLGAFAVTGRKRIVHQELIASNRVGLFASAPGACGLAGFGPGTRIPSLWRCAHPGLSPRASAGRAAQPRTCILAESEKAGALVALKVDPITAR